MESKTVQLRNKIFYLCSTMGLSIPKILYGKREQRSALTSSALWWYEIDGEKKGPIDETKIVTMINTNQIGNNNLVWKEGMGQWASLKDTPFEQYFRKDQPPPITGENVNNKIVWWLAFAPILGKMLEGFFLELFYPAPVVDFQSNSSMDNYLGYLTHTNFDAFWFVTLALNVFLCLQDEKKLKNAGHDTKKLGSVFVVPVYLFKRAEMLKQNNAYFWVWIICFVLTLL
jgi:hypothetical protein